MIYVTRIICAQNRSRLTRMLSMVSQDTGAGKGKSRAKESFIGSLSFLKSKYTGKQDIIHLKYKKYIYNKI